MNGYLIAYLVSIPIAWALHVVWDSIESKQLRLAPQVYYVAFAIVWPVVAFVVSMYLFGDQALFAWRWLSLRARVLREGWRRAD
jgi:hypothetical protein